MVRLPEIVVQQIDDWAAANAVTRAEAVRQMVEAVIRLGGLKA